MVKTSDFDSENLGSSPGEAANPMKPIDLDKSPEQIENDRLNSGTSMSELDRQCDGYTLDRALAERDRLRAMLAEEQLQAKAVALKAETFERQYRQVSQDHASLRALNAEYVAALNFIASAIPGSRGAYSKFATAQNRARAVLAEAQLSNDDRMGEARGHQST